jgi:NAD(P)-dependent dehydrogenase (short-subunit alcohol dehydrogenase family)
MNAKGTRLKIAGSVFLITGASSGLGAASAAMAVEGGGKVVLSDINDEAGKRHAQALGKAARFVHTDVTDDASVRGAIDAAVTSFGGLQALVCCAGIAPGEKVLGKARPHTLESFVRAININLIGTFNMIRLAAEVMSGNEPNEEGERGVIVCTASVAAFDGQIGQAAYSASKGAVAAMTLPIARELARHGIRVMTIAPGIFDTPMLRGLPQEVQDSLGKSVPFPPRLGKPSEFAQLVRSICENTMLNGEVIRLDGALRMAPK